MWRVCDGMVEHAERKRNRVEEEVNEHAEVGENERSGNSSAQIEHIYLYTGNVSVLDNLLLEAKYKFPNSTM